MSRRLLTFTRSESGSGQRIGFVPNWRSLIPLLKLSPILIIIAVASVSLSSVLADTAILVALPSEQSALSREVRVVGQSVELAQHRVSIGYHKGEKLYIVRTGAGNLNSAMVTQALLTRYKIDRSFRLAWRGISMTNGKFRGQGLTLDILWLVVQDAEHGATDSN